MLEIFIILLVAAADQVTKYIAVQYLKPLKTVPILEGLFSLTYVENRGAAFGILQNQRWFLIAIPLLIIIAAVIYLFLHQNDGLLSRISLSVILGGAIGNLIDRIFLGYVVDMLEATFISFPVFNVADMAVVCGTIALSCHLLFFHDSRQV
ncbi:MAG: signal peptidase II [Caldicoprobacterales bacterium]|jgi:signal peptidase II|nr:signal peptidase II [Clostridiales bacterium]